MHNLNQMPYPLITILFLFSFNIIQFPTLITSKPTTTLYSPITRDDTTNLYTIQIYLKTPLQPSQLHLDLGSYLPWYDCSRHYKSSSYQPVIYNTSLCLTLDTKIYANCFDKPGPGCSNDTCGFYPENPVTGKVGLARILTDKFTVGGGSSDPGRPGPVSEIVLACSFPNAKVYRGLAKGSKGLATLGRFNYSLSGQISRNFDAPRIFALCLPRSSKAPGVVVFNSPGPYNFSPDTELSKSLVYTPLIQGPRGSDTVIFYWYKSPDYYIGLTSFKVNDKSVPLNQTLLAIDENGLGGTKLSTSHPYTVLQTSIFKALTDAFVKEINVLNLTVLVKPVDPFKFCYSADAGASTPTIDLVMGNGEVAWRIYGSNSMVRIKSGDVDAWCLGFVDGGLNTKTSIVIGGYQVEDNLVQFDLEKERLGFSSSLLVRHGTSCANFKV